ncbi:hypothetical protein [Streptomyces decoyicus]|uniref:hypothetical protein n=1 Tax=Streptomyces decoyicus TaxID=249567 RepID=UPI000A66B475|nr:hypothetical protein [Streptomyces decoyicus]QZY21040.1 hypothetical protein K7C20_27220 [Streptomyces decoyicus]
MAADEEWAVTLICEWGGCRRVERFESRRKVCDGRRFPVRENGGELPQTSRRPQW